jgi:hypothetical protein
MSAPTSLDTKHMTDEILCPCVNFQNKIFKMRQDC